MKNEITKNQTETERLSKRISLLIERVERKEIIKLQDKTPLIGAL